jgi:hypothetical protein
MTNIVETRPGDENFHLFQDFPGQIYPSGSAHFSVPETLNEDFLQACYVLLIDGKVQGRAALYDNPQLKYKNIKSCCIGNYEAINSEKAGPHLLNHMMSIAKNSTAQYVIGPMNGSTWDNYRFSTDHDEPSFFLEPYHHLYYNQHFLAAGFEAIGKYYSNRSGTQFAVSADILENDRKLQNAGVTMRSIDLSNYGREMERIHDFNTFAFSHNFLYTPITKEAFMKKYAGAKRVLNPRLTLLAEDRDGNLIGYYFCIDDLLDSNRKSLIFKTLVRHPDPKWQGMGHVMGNRIYQQALLEGYESFIHPFIFKNGTSTKLSANFLGERFKNYVLYGRELV